VAAVFVHFPINKRNFLHKNKRTAGPLPHRAVDDQSDISFSIPEETLPRQATFAGFNVIEICQTG